MARGKINQHPVKIPDNITPEQVSNWMERLRGTYANFAGISTFPDGRVVVVMNSEIDSDDYKNLYSAIRSELNLLR